MITNFPNKGDNKKISLTNSKFRQFNYEFAESLQADYPKIWKAGGNEYGNTAFKNWKKARKKGHSKSLEKWIVRRERFLERHSKDKNLPGIVATIKWGGIVSKGAVYMKKIVNEEKKKLDSKN
ncbi:MAG: hypothetical protein ACRC28_03900 [Clostridium sp.]|uniref:hypothetical protein n=1 Tax=Clostridium sp. TaxID=1506 RepID=UPI003F3B54C8